MICQALEDTKGKRVQKPTYLFVAASLKFRGGKRQAYQILENKQAAVILLVGVPGAGKSRVADEIEVQWHRTSDGGNSDFDELETFKFVVRINLRDIRKGTTFWDHIKKKFPQILTTSSIEVIKTALIRMEVLWMLDGFDESDDFGYIWQLWLSYIQWKTQRL